MEYSGKKRRQAKQPECVEDVLVNLHRYPLVVWNDPEPSQDSEDSLLQFETMKPLSSFVASTCESGEEIEWKDLMEWFVCAAIGLESTALWCNDSFLFDWSDVVVDSFGIARINMFHSPACSSPPPSPQSFTDGISCLSQLFLDLIRQLCSSTNLPSHFDQNYRNNVVSSILSRLIHHLVSTGHLVPIDDTSTFEELVRGATDICADMIIHDTSMIDDCMWMTNLTYSLVASLERTGFVHDTVRLTDPDVDLHSPQFQQFSILLDPETEKLRREFDGELFEEAGRISMWREFLQKVGDGEEVEIDTSFLKLSFFRPTLLSLQAKFQQLASSVDGSEDSSTSSLISSHSSPHTSLEALLDSSLRTLSSSSHFRQESLRLLTILHTLLTSPLPSSPTHKFRIEHFGPRSTLINPDTITPNEIFDSSLFDEADNEKLARSLVRCKSVCELVGAEKCILDIENFIDRTVSVLGTSDSLLRAAAGALFNILEDVPCVLSMLPHLWNRLRSAFRDGPHEEQCALIRISSKWIISQMGDRSLPPFPATKFDWDGLINADLRELQPFVFSVFLILFLQHRSIKEQIGSGQRDSITQSFEMHQHAVSRIITIFEDIIQRLDGADDDLNLISYCLLISLRFNRDFPPTLTSILTLYPEIDAHTLLPLENIYLWLCHSSLNRHKPHQPPLDFLFERTLRLAPLAFFLHDSEPDAELSHSLLNTSLCGFHALCRRGMHLDVMESELVRSGGHLANSFLLFSSPLISDTFDLFLYFPPPLVVRFFLPILSSLSNPSFLVEPLRMIVMTLLLVTAPFGDCHSLRELYRSVDQLTGMIEDDSTESEVRVSCESLEWLNIPTGFGSALAHSHSRLFFDPFDDQLSAFHSSSHSPDNTNLSTAMFTFLSNQVQNVSNRICLFGLVTQHLNRSNAPVFLRSKFPDLCGMMLSAAIVVTCHRPDRQKVSCGDSTTPVHDWDAALGSFSEGKRRDSDKRSCHLSWSVRPLVDL
ncbi:hypothetical protein BLNAU_25059 [Blattamonas nauphoetae]|uniref:Uncharacterized protein n=1 Tax=Blattamonas nauphoetae TaxID=2049346 RepID=A0ABQ9WKN8_9EUKA|nr:hypothetical protein BLNAU_25059 [Blattamonas nauphoetae]